MSIDIEQIAHVCHEANRALQLTQGDPAVSPHFMEAPEWQIQSAYEGVQAAIDGATSEELHKSWVDFKVKDGWVYGDVKDSDKKTHPCIVPYSELSEDQRIKDRIFNAIVNAFTEGES